MVFRVLGWWYIGIQINEEGTLKPITYMNVEIVFVIHRFYVWYFYSL